MDYQQIRERLARNQRSRDHWGALWQDFHKQRGEIFLGPLTQREFDALPLRTKRNGGRAHDFRGGFYPIHNGDEPRVDAYVQRLELESMEIK